MAPITPEMAKAMLENNIQQWADNLNVQQKALEFMTRDAQRGMPLDQVWEDIQGGKLGESMVHTRGQIQAMQNYLAQARAALAQGGQATMNFVGRMGNAGAAIAEEAGAFYTQHQPEANTLATATGGKVVQYTVQSAATTGAEAGTAGAIGETTVAATGGAIGETTVAATGGAIAETTVAATGGAIAETTVAGGVVAAEAGGGGAVVAGATGGSLLGPLGIVVGIVIGGVILGGIYVYSQSGDKKPVAAVSTASSSPDTDSSASDSESSSSDTDSSSDSASSGTASSDTSSSVAGNPFVAHYAGTFEGLNPPDQLCPAGEAIASTATVTGVSDSHTITFSVEGHSQDGFINATDVRTTVADDGSFSGTSAEGFQVTGKFTFGPDGTATAVRGQLAHPACNAVFDETRA
jgi:hypothetical protein